MTADHIFIDGEWKTGFSIHLDSSGRILEISSSTPSEGEVKHKGALIPGFVNTHCHLELSHMRSMLPTGTGLINFIFGVLSQRDHAESDILKAIAEADDQMYTAGIQAVGDICNTSYTIDQKQKSKIRYANFVEAYDLWQGTKNSSLFQSHVETFKNFRLKDGDYKIMVPHAPYSVSEEAFAQIAGYCQGLIGTTSLHNQETPDENMFFTEKKGGFAQFFEKLGLSTSSMPDEHTSSLAYAISQMSNARKTLLVHNTISKKEDIRKAQEWNDEVYWVTCPNANLYIENRLPDYAAWMAEGVNIAIGTDSLTSNWQLSILEEMKTISKYSSGINPETLVSWATANGADALGFDSLGRFRQGNQPGVLSLNFNPEREKSIDSHHQIHRLV